MQKVNRIISAIVTVCFLFNIAIQDLALGQTFNFKPNTDKLATPSICGQLSPIERRDIVRIDATFKMDLLGLGKRGVTTLNKMLELDGNKISVYNPPDMQFFFHEPKDLNDDIHTAIKCVIKDKAGPRTYWVIVNKNITDKMAPVHILTDKEYRESNNSATGLPSRNAEDAKLMAADLAHEMGMDAILRYAHENGLAKKPVKERFDYNQEVRKLLEQLKIKVSNPNNLIPMGDRPFFLVMVTPQLKRMIADLPKAQIVAKDDEVYEVNYFAHSSNNAIHVLVEDKHSFDVLTDTTKKYDEENIKNIIRDSLFLRETVVHEIGVMLNAELMSVGIRYKLREMVWNTIDSRYLEIENGEVEHEPINFSIVDLDTVAGRDYAAVTRRRDDAEKGLAKIRKLLTPSSQKKLDPLTTAPADDDSDPLKAFQHLEVSREFLSDETAVPTEPISADAIKALAAAERGGSGLSAAKRGPDPKAFAQQLKSNVADWLVMDIDSLRKTASAKGIGDAEIKAAEEKAAKAKVKKEIGLINLLIVKSLNIQPGTVLSVIGERDELHEGTYAGFGDIKDGKGYGILIREVGVKNPVIYHLNTLTSLNIPSSTGSVVTGRAKPTQTPPAGIAQLGVSMDLLADHRIVNSLIKMIICFGEKQRSYPEDRFVEPEAYNGIGIYWLGDNQCETFADVFRKFCTMSPGSQEVIEQEFSRIYSLMDFPSESLDAILILQLKLQLEHFGVENGCAYVPKGLKRYKDVIVEHVRLERRYHDEVIKEKFIQRKEDYNKWREGNYKIPVSVVGHIQGNMTYNEFASKAHQEAEVLYPLANILGRPVLSDKEVDLLKTFVNAHKPAQIPVAGVADAGSKDSAATPVPIPGDVNWLNTQQATSILNTIPDIGTVKGLEQLSNWAEKNNPAYLEYLKKFEPGLKQMSDILKRTRPVDELNNLVAQNALVLKGEKPGDPGMYDRQIRRLDILRGLSELILQLVPEENGVDNPTRLAKIKYIFVKQPEFSRLLVEYFETRFNPGKNLNERGKAAGKIRLEMLNMLRTNMKTATPEEHFILEKAIRILVATMKTNYYVEERVNLLFRINPRAIVGDDETGALVNTPPSALIWVHVPYGAYGAHSRYIDDARGGLRLMESKDSTLLNQVLATCGALTVVQNDKHTDIPEAGSKGAYIHQEGLNVVAATIGYIDGLITCMKEDDFDRIAVSSDAATIDPLYLGPDVGTDKFTDIATALAWMKGLENWRLLITGKSQVLGGVCHKSNNLLDPVERGNRVTSQGVMEHVKPMVRYLRDIFKIRSKEGEPVIFTITGGLDGDVGSGLIERTISYYGDKAIIRADVDGSGVMFDPEGLDHATLLGMYKSGDTAKTFPVEKLHEGGFVAEAKKGSSDDCYITLGNDSLKYMNTRALDPDVLRGLGVENQYKQRAGLKSDEPLVKILARDSEFQPTVIKVHTMYLRDAMFFIVKSDMLLTGSTGKDNINEKNWPLFFTEGNNPVSIGIVHGANVFIHNNATIELEKKGVVIEPDEKANSVGVEISSRVEIDFNFIFGIDEIKRPLLASYFEQVLTKCLENARKKFWALRVEAADHPDESVVTKVSPRISTEIIELASRISRSSLIKDRKSDYDAAVLEYLKNYFPDVSEIDKEYASTLDRVFARMPVNRIKAIAAKVMAKDIVLNLGTGAISAIAKNTGSKQIDVVFQYLKVADETKVNDKIKAVVDNKDNFSPGEQIAKIKAIRQELKTAIENDLKSKQTAATAQSETTTSSATAAATTETINTPPQEFNGPAMTWTGEMPNGPVVEYSAQGLTVSVPCSWVSRTFEFKQTPREATVYRPQVTPLGGKSQSGTFKGIALRSIWNSTKGEEKGALYIVVSDESAPSFANANYLDVKIIPEAEFAKLNKTEMAPVLKDQVASIVPAVSAQAETTTSSATAATTVENVLIDDMSAIATQAGIEIPTDPSGRYNLLITEEFFTRNGEFSRDKAKYADRFDLDTVSGATPQQFIANVLAKAKGKELQTVVLVPNYLQVNDLEKLAKAGIRFVRTDIVKLLDARDVRDPYREKFHLDTYVTMLLIRRIDKDVTPDSPLYRLLSFYMKTHFSFTDMTAVTDYINALAVNDVARLIKASLIYRPIQQYDIPTYENVAEALISA